MKLLTLKNFKHIFIATLFIAAFITALCALGTPSVPQGAVAEAADIGIISVTYDGEEYVCSDSTGVILFVDASLQSVINYAESSYSQINYEFDSLTVREPIIFKKNSLLQGQGTVNFVLNTASQNTYAMTVNSKATLILQGPAINSNRGVINVENGSLEIRSATITVAGCTVSQSAINVQGSALISGGTIIYADKSNNSAFGYGVSVNGGSLTVTPEVPVKIEGHSALCITSGSAILNGGEYKANRPNTENTSSGFSVDVQGGDLTVTDGELNYPIYDRTPGGAKINISGVSVASVRATPKANKKINIGSVQIQTGSYCELNINNIDLAAHTLQISGKKSSGGFRTVGFTVNGTKTDEPVLTLDTDEQQTVVPIESNLYGVSLSCDGAVYETLSYAFGATVSLSALPSPEKLGYTLSGWVEKETDFTITDDITLTAITELNCADIEITGTELTYNGTEQTITPTLSHDLTVSYTAIWERFETSSWVKVCDGEALRVTTVAQSGTYRITVVATAVNGIDTSSTQKEVGVTISKGTYSGITHSEFSGVYDPDKSLSDYALQPGFSWVDVSTVPTVPIKLYPAIYNADPDNYKDCEVSIKIDLTKAAAVSAPPHRNLSGVYEKKKLKDYPLDDGFRWQSPEQIPVVSTTSYTALYNPDIDNYEDTVRTLVLNLEKGSFVGVEHLKDMTMTYRPNYYLSDLSSEISTAHANYRVDFTYDRKINAGTRDIPCAYNEDSANYNDYTFTISLTVYKANINPSDVPEVPSFEDVYSGLPLLEYQLGGYFYWCDETAIPTVDVREYDAFYNPEQENYNDYQIKVTVTLTKGAYENIVAPTLTITYDRNKALSAISLPAGWSWITPTIIPTVAVSSYEAQYCADPVNYLPYAAVITMTVNKADIPLAVLPDKTVTYDGNEHSLKFEYLPYPLEVEGYVGNGQVQAGPHSITAKLLQTDTDNYNLHPTTVSGILTILKAPSVINAPTRYDILRGGEFTIEGSVENNEQTLVIPEFNETAVGVYHINLTTAESINYLAGSLTVTISINRPEKYVGNIRYPENYDGSYLYGILVNTDSGVPNDAEISIHTFACDNYYLGINISVIVDNSAYDESFTVKIRMTDEMLSAIALSLFSSDGTEVAYTVENGVYMVFEGGGNEVFYLQAAFKDKFAWYWIPIGIAIALIAIGTVLVILWKKGKIKIPHKASAQETATQNAAATVAEDIKEQ